MSEFEEQITVLADVDKVWDVLADIGNIHLWNPGVVDAKKTSAGEVKLGSSRHCDLGGKNFLVEDVVEFDRPGKLTLRITDTNLPFDTADIRFLIEPRGNNSVVTVSPKYRLKFGWLGRVLDALIVRSQYRKGMRELLRGLKGFVEKHVESSR